MKKEAVSNRTDDRTGHSGRGKILVLSFLLFGSSLLFAACSSVKPYQRAYLNDSEMEFGVQPVAGFEEYVETIREGSSGGGAEKGSGGCGCN